MSNTAHIISHTHWDREWYINSKFTNEWLPPFFDALFQMMEREPDYKFVLDGQMSIVDDYLDELKKSGKPLEEAKQKIKKYAGQGRLVLGPYYLQPDWQLISDEAAVRNLLLGRQTAREYGGEMRVGWLLDNFGQISQSPQLHAQFGINGLVVWRGVELDPFQMKSEFLWESPDHTRLPCAYLLSSYRNAMRLAEYGAIFYERVKSEIEKICPFSSTSDILLMNGYDQEMVPDDILPYLRDGKADCGGIRVIQSTPQEFMEQMASQIPGNLAVLKGALYSGRYISVFPGVLSCRMYLKQQNEECQTALERYAEPLSAVLGAQGVPGFERRKKRLWKTLLKNHPHDSICGVGVDDVHTDMEQRFKTVRLGARRLWREEFRMLFSAVDTSLPARQRFGVFFSDASGLPLMLDLPVHIGKGGILTDGKQRLEFQSHRRGVTVSLPNPPGTGYQVLYMREGKEPLPESSPLLQTGESRIENRFFQLSIHPDGSLELIHKATGRTYSGIGILEDGGDAGDEYNYSPPAQDRIVLSKGQQAEIRWIQSDCLKAVFQIYRELALPAELAEDRRERRGAQMLLPVAMTVTVERDSPLVKFHVELKNTVKDHRLRMLFPTLLDGESSFARTQFDVTEHPIRPQPFDNENIPENVRRIIIGAREPAPATCFPMRRFCGMDGPGAGAAVLARGLTEYEVLPEDSTLALTLFRSVGYLARTDLSARIGDAGPEICTPDAQCLREMEFDCAFYPYAGDWKQANLMGWSESFCVPPVWAGLTAHEGELPDQLFWLSIDAPGHTVGITGVKRSEDGRNTVLRLFNADKSEAAVTVSAGVPLRGVWQANLAEEIQEALPFKKGRASLKIPAGKIVTLLLGLSFEQTLSVKKHSAGFPASYRGKGRFDRFPSLPVVTEEEALAEQRRAELLERELADLERNPPAGKEQSPQSLAEAERFMRREAVRRAALEARLSALLVHKKDVELNWDRNSPMDELEWLDGELREISLKLNRARLSKRAGEYIADYYRKAENSRKEER